MKDSDGINSLSQQWINLMCVIFHSQLVRVNNIDDFIMSCANDDYQKDRL